MISHFNKLEELLHSLIDDIHILLPQTDVKDALEMITYNEYGIAFEIICNQLFEHNIKITSEIYEKIIIIGKLMKMNETSWNFLEQLIEK
jgi:hypothetical protein